MGQTGPGRSSPALHLQEGPQRQGPGQSEASEALASGTDTQGSREIFLKI